VGGYTRIEIRDEIFSFSVETYGDAHAKKTMKHFAGKAFATVLFSTLVVLGIAPNVQAQPGCSAATLSGTFGYTNTGTILAGPDVGPFGGVGRQSFDGKGNTQATATVSVNGNIFHVTIKGTYVVNSDCSGSMILTVSAGPEHLQTMSIL
jgi:hypothetical protein